MDPVEPLDRLSSWLQAAREASAPMPEAMTLATATSDGLPSARMVVLRGVDTGLVWLTDAGSAKGVELAANPRAAAVLHWLVPVHRQVRVVGAVEPAGTAVADAYWAGRPPPARRNAIASHQSAVVAAREVVEAAVAALVARDPEGRDLPRPDRWRGYRLVPAAVEFWEEAADGIHDRICYLRGAGGWDVDRLSP